MSVRASIEHSPPIQQQALGILIERGDWLRSREIAKELDVALSGAWMALESLVEDDKAVSRRPDGRCLLMSLTREYRAKRVRVDPRTRDDPDDTLSTPWEWRCPNGHNSWYVRATAQRYQLGSPGRSPRTKYHNATVKGGTGPAYYCHRCAADPSVDDPNFSKLVHASTFS